MTTPPNEPRIAPLPRSEWDADTVELIGKMISTDGEPLNIFATIAQHPKLLKRWLVFAAHVLSKNELPPRHRELLILRTGWRSGARYEWAQHATIARELGMTSDEINAVKVGAGSPIWSPFEAVLLRAADELHESANITDETWRALADVYDTHQLLEVPFTVGQYRLVSMVLNSCGVQLENGVDSAGFDAERAE